MARVILKLGDGFQFMAAHSFFHDLTALERNPGRAAILLTGAWFMLLALFYALPQIDIDVAQLFFFRTACSPEHAAAVCGTFPLSKNGFLGAVRKLLFYMPHVAGVVVLVALIIGLRRARGMADRKHLQPLFLALTSVMIGPYLLVNMYLKEDWGRPRPNQTDLFGGHLAFVPAGSPFGTCDQNCSFISGEAAGAGWLICLLPLLPVRARRFLGLPIIVVSLLTPLLRVSFGAHYLSDAVLGWLSSPVVFAIVVAVAQWQERRKNRRSASGSAPSSTGE
ncbi:phosphatase PAP2 family protein [Rhizobium paknamense]|uniref:Membrane-associated phospholipid phosphatase n=1 Tax=Rhizobium paknamense TaxID=1206817 RepID=A0ABU0I937_9HYPH|nr:phosphatase PAP2 family protein [Rhizobium paknamense]MDQ0454133.1 membrane-associated phospholipid phosphatase [Rhizobium paknamense]